MNESFFQVFLIGFLLLVEVLMKGDLFADFGLVLILSFWGCLILYSQTIKPGDEEKIFLTFAILSVLAMRLYKMLVLSDQFYFPVTCMSLLFMLVLLALYSKSHPIKPAMLITCMTCILLIYSGGK